MARGDRADGFQQRGNRPPLDVVTCRVLEDLAQCIRVAAVKVFWCRRGHTQTLTLRPVALPSVVAVRQVADFNSKRI